MDAVEKSNGRLIKPHRKSRKGCSNCKLRRVKCDEGKPICKRCKASGYFCNYGGNNASLELLINGLPRLHAFDVVSFSLRPVKSDGIGRYVFEENDLDLLSKFRTRTVLTITTDRIREVYQNHIIEIAPYHPFLMHSLLALTMMHDRHLQCTPAAQTTTETFHQYQSIALFNARLAKPVQPSPAESAALLVTAIILGIMSFCRVEAKTPGDAWPLIPTSASDLAWIAMSEGKTQLWKMTQPSTTESRFAALVPPSAKGVVPKSSTMSELSVLPLELVNMCGLDKVADNSNPYHAVAATLAKALDMAYISTLLSFLVLINNIPQEYKLLLKQKDPRALLLLAYWYAKLCEVELWWMRPRASLEGHAICVYLRRYHQDDSQLQSLMRDIWTGIREQIPTPVSYC